MVHVPSVTSESITKIRVLTFLDLEALHPTYREGHWKLWSHESPTFMVVNVTTGHRQCACTDVSLKTSHATVDTHTLLFTHGQTYVLYYVP